MGQVEVPSPVVKNLLSVQERNLCDAMKTLHATAKIQSSHKAQIRRNDSLGMFVPILYNFGSIPEDSKMPKDLISTKLQEESH